MKTLVEINFLYHYEIKNLAFFNKQVYQVVWNLNINRHTVIALEKWMCSLMLINYACV